MNHEKADFFDSQVDAPWADTPYGRAEKPKLERLFFHCGPLKGRTVLEPGCGTGRLTQALSLAVGPTGCVYACDISPKMVSKARECTCGIPQARVSYAAMEDLDIEAESVDLVICHQVFPHFFDKSSALGWIDKVLKPEGALLIVHFECRDVINDVHRKAGTAVKHDNLPDREEMAEMLSAANFQIEYYSDDPDLGYLLKANRVLS
ncbi:MAG: class I SAM-dependent methyltransferase [Desulfobacteraceae bacterium]|jgi:demethylmenaquinone methyltransferase/2-methoxy-6-polyprenyl-1,4-benzoquinol methylase